MLYGILDFLEKLIVENMSKKYSLKYIMRFEVNV